MERELRILLVVSGFPSADKPINGIFSLRFAKLSKMADVAVVHLHARLPDSPLILRLRRRWTFCQDLLRVRKYKVSVLQVYLCAGGWGGPSSESSWNNAI